MKLIRLVLLAAAGMLIAFAPTSYAQEASLNLVPSKAPIVVQVNGFDKARNRLGQFLGNSLPDLAPKLVKQIDDGIKGLAEGRDLKSITKDGRIYLVLTDLANLFENPTFSVLVPVTSYAEFKDGFLKADERKSLKKEADGYESVKFEDKDELMYLIERKEYAIICSNKDEAKAYAKGSDAGLGKTLSKETAKAFLDQDVSVYVNLKSINKEFGDKVKEFKGTFEMLLQGAMGIDKKQTEIIKQVFDGLIQLLQDGVAAIIGLDFRTEGVNLKFFAQFGAETETNTFLKKIKPSTLREIGSLPGGQLAYSASNFDPSLSKTLSAMLKEMSVEDENEDAKKIIDAALQELTSNKRSIDLSTSNTLMGGFQIAEYQDGPKAVASQMKMLKAMSKTSSFQSLPLKEKPEIKENAESVGDYKLHMVKLVFDFDKAVQALDENLREATKATMMKLTGEGMTLWIGHSGNKVVQVNAKDWKEAKARIEAYIDGKNSLDKDESYQATRKQLPSEATLLVMADTARFLQMVVDLMKDAFAGVPGFPGGGIPQLIAPKGKPAYLGLAIVLRAEYASFDLFVPVTAVQQVRKMLAPLIDKDN